jgi:hypothetical protein
MAPTLIWLIAVVSITALSFGGGPVPTPSGSASSVDCLTRLMSHLQLETIAATDVTEPRRFVAAWHVRQAPILAVSARSAEPRLVEEHISAGRFGVVYFHLVRESDVHDRWFVEDYGADGLTLASSGSRPVDVVYESVERRIVFDGRPTARGLPPQDHVESLIRAERQYVRMLRALITQLLNTGQSAVTGTARDNGRGATGAPMHDGDCVAGTRHD